MDSLLSSLSVSSLDSLREVLVVFGGFFTTVFTMCVFSYFVIKFFYSIILDLVEYLFNKYIYNYNNNNI